MMLTLLLLAGALLGVLLSGFVSAVETGGYVLNRVQLRVRSEQRDRRAMRLAQVIQHPEDFVVTLLLANTVADFIATGCVVGILRQAALAESVIELIATLIMTPIVLVFGGIIPKDWFQREADRTMYPLSGLILAGIQIGRWSGVVPALRWVTRTLIRWIDPSQANADDSLLPRMHIQRLLHEGAARVGLTPFQRDAIDRVMKISQVRVGDVMIPVARAAIVSADVSRENFLRAARMAHFSRMPVHQPGDARRVVGIINVHDVFADPQARPMRDYIRPAIRVSEGEPVPAALLRLQESREAMGIATDAFGNSVGLFTIKDLVEEIVGELEVW